MRILHTSDWHLGQYFFTQSRLEEHQRFVDWLCDCVSEQGIDAVIIAGDVFDTGSPPSYARELYNRLVVKLNQLKCKLVVLAGNHDSVAVLDESKQLLSYLDAQVVTTASADLSKQLLTLTDKAGKPGAIVCAVPFLRPRDVTKQVEGSSSKQRQQDLSEAIAGHYHSLYEQAVELRDSIDNTLPIIGTGHLTALGVSQSESVRDIYIGTLDGFAANQFPPFDYLALGHIHRPQLVSKKSNFRYSGSPIALSFDEANTQKSVVVIDTEGGCEPRLLAIPTFRALVSLSGDLAELEAQITKLEPSELKTWLSVSVHSSEQYADLQAKVQALLEGIDATVLRIQRHVGERSHTQTEIEQSLDELTPNDVFLRKLEMVINQEPTEQEVERYQRITEHFSQILTEVELQAQPEDEADNGKEAVQ